MPAENAIVRMITALAERFQCDHCQGWWHKLCSDIHTDEFDSDDVPWFCSLCHSSSQLEQQGQLTSSQLSSILASVPPQEHKYQLGKHIFPLIKKVVPVLSDIAGKITGWLLQREQTEIIEIVEMEEESLKVVIRQYAERLNPTVPLSPSASPAYPSPLPSTSQLSSQFCGAGPPPQKIKAPPGLVLSSGEYDTEDEETEPSAWLHSTTDKSPPPTQLSGSAVHLLKHMHGLIKKWGDK